MKALEFNLKNNTEKLNIYQAYCDRFNKLFDNEDFEMFVSISYKNKYKLIEEIFTGIHWITEE